MKRLSVFLLWPVLLISLSYSASAEEITLTTYYPAPYGVYKEMRVKQLVVGDVDPTSTPAPSDGAVTFMPTSRPSVYSEGTLYYNDADNEFEYYNGSAWQKF